LTEAVLAAQLSAMVLAARSQMKMGTRCGPFGLFRDCPRNCKRRAPSESSTEPYWLGKDGDALWPASQETCHRTSTTGRGASERV